MKIIVMLFLSIGVLAGCSQAYEEQADEMEIELEETAELLEADIKTTVESMQQGINEQVEEIDKAIVTEGEEAIITRNLLLPLHEDGYHDLYGYVETSDYENIIEMRDNGNLLFIEGNTEVEVLDIDMIQAKVKIISTGEEGYIPVKFLEQISAS